MRGAAAHAELGGHGEKVKKNRTRGRRRRPDHGARGMDACPCRAAPCRAVAEEAGGAPAACRATSK
jgi:hypothetical protein